VAPEATPAYPTAAEVLLETNRLDAALALQRYRAAAVLTHYYGVGNLAGYAGAADYDATKPSNRYRALTSLTQQNGLRAVIDTRMSQTVRVPDLRVQTKGGRYARQRSARKVAQWLSGSFKRQDLARIVWQVATDASTCPLGAARVWYEKDGLHLCRVRPDQIIWNPREGKRPRNLRLRYGVHRETLARMFPDFKDHIMGDGAPKYEEDSTYAALDLVGAVEADMVEVVEHWRRGPDGCYTIVCGDQILNPKTRAWEHSFFPVVELVDCPSWDSFAGHSIGEQLLPYQLTLNRMVRTTEIGQDRLSKGRVFLPIGSQTTAGSPTDRQQFSRTVGEFIEYNAAFGKVEIQPGIAFSAEWYRRMDKVEAAMWELAGVDRVSGGGAEPASLADASGKARRERNETVTARHKRYSDMLDDWFERLCMTALAMGKDWFGSEEGKSSEGSKVFAAVGTGVLEQVDWAELDIEELAGIEVQAVSVSGLPMHPSARLEYAKEGYETGFWNKTYAIKLLAQPDMEKAEDSATSAFDLATHHIEGALFDGKRFDPEPQREYLEILLDIGRRELMQAVRLGCDDSNVELLRRGLESAEHLLTLLPPDPTAAPQAAPAAGQVPPVTAPGAGTEMTMQ
jgi:hypothetical protein